MPTFADAILDRLVHYVHRLALDGPSMRESPRRPSRIPQRPGPSADGYDGHETADRSEKMNNPPSGPPMRGAAFELVAVTSRRARAPPIA